MTCIAGLISPRDGFGDVWIGGDSAGVAGWDISIRKDPKVFTVGEFLIGFTSSFRMGQLLRFSFKPKPIEKDLYNYMCTDFVEALRDCFKSGGYLQSENGADSGGTFLVGVRGRLFEIEDDFQVAEPLDGFAAVGCGKFYAKASLYTTAKSLSPKDSILSALKCATYFSGGVRPPYTILCQHIEEKSIEVDEAVVTYEVGSDD